MCSEILTNSYLQQMWEESFPRAKPDLMHFDKKLPFFNFSFDFYRYLTFLSQLCDVIACQKHGFNLISNYYHKCQNK